ALQHLYLIYEKVFANKIKVIKKLAQQLPRVFPALRTERLAKRLHPLSSAIFHIIVDNYFQS
ncbi:hypothetical protein, partial [Phascolarctobacterium succinatutens]|uniref:hypothetical protein n=1 Tax=Phascolarctobacterium succinatutens TaxID=626940 RepID=UPI0026EE9083